MKAVFADTFCWVALTSPADPAFERSHQIKDQVVTIDEVLTEYLTFFSASEYLRRKAASNVQMILQEPDVHVIPQSRESFLAGLKLYQARPDKGYSLTDYISMCAMRTEGITDVLTNDRHFEQEGYHALFRGV